MAYKTQGYTRGAEDVGPQFLPRVVKRNYSQSDTLERQAEMTSDPARKQQLMLIAALERRYQDQVQLGQQGVQDAALAPGGDFIYGSPQQKMAQMRRQGIMQKAAQEYNNSLPLGHQGGEKDLALWFYGA